MDQTRKSSADGALCDSSNHLFDDTVIRNMTMKGTYLTKKDCSYPSLGNDLIARPLNRTDYDKEYLKLLSQLTKVGDCNKETFEAQFDAMKASKGVYYIVVIEDTSLCKVVASASLLIEHKFIHGAAIRGRIEDVVVDKDYRSLHLGSFLLDLLTCLSEELGCYKITLDCKPGLEGFYEKFGYTNEGQLFLSKRFRD